MNGLTASDVFQLYKERKAASLQKRNAPLAAKNSTHATADTSVWTHVISPPRMCYAPSEVSNTSSDLFGSHYNDSTALSSVLYSRSSSQSSMPLTLNDLSYIPGGDTRHTYYDIDSSIECAQPSEYTPHSTPRKNHRYSSDSEDEADVLTMSMLSSGQDRKQKDIAMATDRLHHSSGYHTGSDLLSSDSGSHCHQIPASLPPRPPCIGMEAPPPPPTNHHGNQDISMASDATSFMMKVPVDPPVTHKKGRRSLLKKLKTIGRHIHRHGSSGSNLKTLAVL